MPSKPVNGEQRGWIIPIGGAEDKDANPSILQRFVELCGGSEADIVVIPTASRLKDTGPRYEELFRGMGVAQVEVLDFDTRRDCQEPNRLAPGLGLTNRFVIDQHFRQRDRLGRLVAALAYNPFAIGIGLDEDTAAFIGPDNTLEVEGSGAVTVVDADGLTFSSMAQVSEDEPVCLLGLTVHILVAGATFNLHTRKASAGSLARAKSE